MATVNRRAGRWHQKRPAPRLRNCLHLIERAGCKQNGLCYPTHLEIKLSQMDPLKDISNKLSSVPKLEYVDTSPPKPGSPKLGSPTRLFQSPARVSPFKGPRALQTDQEIFAVTPRRLAHYRNKSQSADRVSFSEMTGMAPSLRVTQTPSRMISSKKAVSQSEQPKSRLLKPTLASQAKSLERPILKRRLSPPTELNEDDTDIRTLINTHENAKSARSVIEYLHDTEPSSPQPRKKRSVNFEDPDETSRLLYQILENQQLILQRLQALEDKVNH